jgi:tRNA pseudouridine38-40 synthase
MATTPPWPASSSSRSSSKSLTLFGDQAAVPPPAVIEGPTVRVRLDLAYLGTGFHGFAVQPGIRTVGGVLTAALERNLRHTVEITCAGRTDAGVHAWDQVVTFDARADVDPPALQRAVNKTLRPAIAVRAATVAPPGFDARRSATGRTYRYTIVNRATPDPFSAATAWHLARPLDLGLLRLACDPLIGEHDFGSFCRAGGSLVRRVRRAEWSDRGDGALCFEIEASSFCQQMVRAAVGTMVEMGLGKRRSGEMATILRAKDRAAAGQLAPPHGLCLWNVEYGERG